MVSVAFQRQELHLWFTRCIYLNDGYGICNVILDLSQPCPLGTPFKNSSRFLWSLVESQGLVKSRKLIGVGAEAWSGSLPLQRATGSTGHVTNQAKWTLPVQAERGMERGCRRWGYAWDQRGSRSLVGFHGIVGLLYNGYSCRLLNRWKSRGWTNWKLERIFTV